MKITPEMLPETPRFFSFADLTTICNYLNALLKNGKAKRVPLFINNAGNWFADTLDTGNKYTSPCLIIRLDKEPENGK